MTVSTGSMINFKQIEELCDHVPQLNLTEILTKAKKLSGISLDEAAFLLSLDKDKLPLLFKAAAQVRREVFSEKLVLFAPIYVSNKCVNDCLYCAFRSPNNQLSRKTLSLSEIIDQATILARKGFTRTILVAGEDDDISIDYINDAATEILAKTGIKQVNVNIATLSDSGFKQLSKTPIDIFQLFQETYDPKMYKKLHLSGPKADYHYHLQSMDRALKNGQSEFGMGVLLGLVDHRYEALALLSHISYLDKTYQRRPRTIAVPRWNPAEGKVMKKAPRLLSDDQFKTFVAVMVLSMPTIPVVISTRESEEMRSWMMRLSPFMSAESATSPGGYSDQKAGAQFSLGDYRPLPDVVQSIVGEGYIPSFCTACTGNGSPHPYFLLSACEKKMCRANSLLSMQYYAKSQKLEGIDKKVVKLLTSYKDEIKNESYFKKFSEFSEQIANN
jgi:2-iminoacetate synthase